MKYHTYKKRYSNKQMAANILLINIALVMLALVFLFHTTQIQLSHPKRVIFSLFGLLTPINLFIAMPFLGKLGKYRWRINQLFELYSKTMTVSDKLVFPVVKYGYSKANDLFVFRFNWAGKVSLGTQSEIEHRLSELLFPNNDYLLEEPIKTQAYTRFIYSRRPERLCITYAKRNSLE